MKKRWPTPRLLLEAREHGVWTPVKIYVRYRTTRELIDRLPALAQPFKGIKNVRVKNLHTSEEIAVAKLAVYNHKRQSNGEKT